MKKKQKYFNLETYDYTPYARELTEEEMYLVNGGRRMIGDRTNESEHVSSRPASSNESGSSSGTSATSNSSPAPAETQTATGSSQTNSSSQQNNAESQPQTSSAPTCTAAQMAAAQGAAMNAYFAEQDKKREENNKQQNSSGSSSSSSSSQSSETQHNTNDQYAMAQKDYDEHYGNYTSETATDNSTTYTTSDQYAMAQKDYDEHYGNYTSETTADNSTQGSNSNNTSNDPFSKVRSLVENSKGEFNIDYEKMEISVNIKDVKGIQEAYNVYYILAGQGYVFKLQENGKDIHTFTDDETVKKYLEGIRQAYFEQKNSTPGVYAVDHEAKVVRADINNFENVREAFVSYYILGDRGYTFELCDNSKVIHTFTDEETVDNYIKHVDNWSRNEMLDKNAVLDLDSAIVLKDIGYLKELSEMASVCHKLGYSTSYDTKKNRKFVSFDGKNEYVFNEFGQLVTDPVNMGTYNYSSPGDWFGHASNDLIPWIKWGTGPEDPTTIKERFFATVTFGAVSYKGVIK